MNKGQKNRSYFGTAFLTAAASMLTSACALTPINHGSQGLDAQDVTASKTPNGHVTFSSSQGSVHAEPFDRYAERHQLDPAIVSRFQGKPIYVRDHPDETSSFAAGYKIKGTGEKVCLVVIDPSERLREEIYLWTSGLDTNIDLPPERAKNVLNIWDDATRAHELQHCEQYFADDKHSQDWKESDADLVKEQVLAEMTSYPQEDIALTKDLMRHARLIGSHVRAYRHKFGWEENPNEYKDRFGPHHTAATSHAGHNFSDHELGLHNAAIGALIDYVEDIKIANGMSSAGTMEDTKVHLAEGYQIIKAMLDDTQSVLHPAPHVTKQENAFRDMVRGHAEQLTDAVASFEALPGVSILNKAKPRTIDISLAKSPPPKSAPVAKAPRAP